MGEIRIPESFVNQIVDAQKRKGAESNPTSESKALKVSVEHTAQQEKLARLQKAREQHTAWIGTDGWTHEDGKTLEKMDVEIRELEDQLNAPNTKKE